MTKERPLVRALGLVAVLLAGASPPRLHVASGNALWNETHDAPVSWPLVQATRPAAGDLAPPA